METANSGKSREDYITLNQEPIMVSHRNSVHHFHELEKQPSIKEEDEEDEADVSLNDNIAISDFSSGDMINSIGASGGGDHSEIGTIPSNETLKVQDLKIAPSTSNEAIPALNNSSHSNITNDSSHSNININNSNITNNQELNPYRVPASASQAARKDNQPLLSINSTITFEKQKVLPHRSRAHSGQSVLSSISLRSALQQQNHQSSSNDSTDSQVDTTQTSGSIIQNSLMEITQQIQSPAMCSVRRKGLNSAGAHGSVVSLQRTNSEKLNDIGFHEPFVDDKRVDLDANNNIMTTKNNLKSDDMHSDIQDKISPTRIFSADEKPKPLENSKPSSVISSNKSPTIEDDANDDNEEMQKELTAQALRNLSNMKGLQVSNTFASSALDKDIDKAKSVSENELNEMNSNSITSMTHLQFGKKKVYLDSSPSAFGIDASFNSSQNKRLEEQKSSSNESNLNDQINIQITSQNPIESNKSNNNNIYPNTGRNKRFVKQINDPKKPLYVPAVLRNVSETNITNDDVIWSSIVHNSPKFSANYNNSLGSYFNSEPSSSKASIHSASSYVIDTCKKRISSLFSQNEDHDSSLGAPSLAKIEQTKLPVRTHWIPDSQRNSCRYCHKLFTFWERKHHCRHCGDIFCQQHLRHWLYLNSQAEFIIGGGSGIGTLSKVCVTCAEEYENLIRSNDPLSKLQMDNLTLTKLKNKVGNSSSQGAGTKVMKNIDKVSNSIKIDSDGKNLNLDPNDGADGIENKKQERELMNSVVGSVPVDWNWSSF
ncbi:hypothetical protein Kpol_1025p47 [Vanderwaltozyma polyspora DSM 70294]|uniref:FYVE-type domain-containing protein n=1 Tax=Vanderwaltozyma polyspora (strain ATCC 22028 / DSM 70294 / BCRC 21397 / CBS 2163 / NBRC 10782 / NRRL Y-8283 / UCD 57-17) TaxID=436907 RepID=A7TKX1_VANPO|nr:uncharacterized protein Kpol_1025p47 [Vanderwaltozyma polyspora DSM 70294]EDO17126.1 hypothetical protein Kpol_1025p47 [Vanderwaltozyma polyspora DSM 70294]